MIYGNEMYSPMLRFDSLNLRSSAAQLAAGVIFWAEHHQFDTLYPFPSKTMVKSENFDKVSSDVDSSP